MRKLLILLLLSTQAMVANATCSISSDGIAFGAYQVGVDTIGSGTVLVECVGLPSQTPYNITLSAGYSNDLTQRSMINGLATLQYNIYVDSAFSNIFGDGTVGTFEITGSATATSYSTGHPIYGKIPFGQPGLTPGGYSDNLNLTIEW